jgi:phosphohistidine phosphatase SixA
LVAGATGARRRGWLQRRRRQRRERTRVPRPRDNDDRGPAGRAACPPAPWGTTGVGSPRWRLRHLLPPHGDRLEPGRPASRRLRRLRHAAEPLDDGRDQARAIGEAFERLDIPVGRVLSSPFCRAIDTADIALGRTTPEPAIENLETSADDAEREQRNDGLRRLLSAAPDGGTNTVLTSHGYNIEAVADVTTAEGDGYVFRPEAAGSYVLVATITPDGWGELADQFGGNGE